MSIPVKQKKRGRPATGTYPLIGVRVAPETVARLDAWAKARGVSRSEAIRGMIDATIKMGGLGE